MPIDKLRSISGSFLLPRWAGNEADILSQYGEIGRELLALLTTRNGFYAFESALEVFPIGSSKQLISLASWNDSRLWRSEFGRLIPATSLFFAQDAFGNQFAINGSEIALFYSEFAEFERMASSLNEWTEVILSDWRGYSGFELAHEWQAEHGPLQAGQRLIPKVPFVIGGKYELGNLYCGDIVDAMRFRGSLARQLLNVPDGTPSNIKIM